ncbi:MAG: hypothetical protein QM665_02460, partial [Desulfovibrio sp.]
MQPGQGQHKAQPQHNGFAFKHAGFHMHGAKIKLGPAMLPYDGNDDDAQPDNQHQRFGQRQIKQHVRTQGWLDKYPEGRFLARYLGVFQQAQVPCQMYLGHNEAQIAQGQKQAEELAGCGHGTAEKCQPHAQPGQTDAENMPQRAVFVFVLRGPAAVQQHC